MEKAAHEDEEDELRKGRTSVSEKTADAVTQQEVVATKRA